MEFSDIIKNENILRGIYGYGFMKPSEIQSSSIPFIIDGRDVIAQARSGTGKTGAFVIGLLSRINIEKNKLQGIILSHTRELALQILSVIRNISFYMTGLKVALCIGGTQVNKNIEDAKKSHIMIGTVGRMYDLIVDKHCIDMTYVKTMIMDEADELLNEYKKNEIYQIKNIIMSIPKECQICIFSATIPEKIIEISGKFMNNPEKILVGDNILSVEGIRQFYIYLEHEKFKLSTLKDLYNRISIAQCIIYVNSKEKAEFLKNELVADKFGVSMIHGDMDQAVRMEIMRTFRSGVNRILISTDLLARGIDIQQVNLIINYDIPFEYNCYLHRVGRSGRYGRRGVAVSFVTDRDKQVFSEIEKKFSIHIEEMPADISEFLI
jgi:translation initiation factor 4A